VKDGADVLEIGGHRSGVLPFLEQHKNATCRGIDVSAIWVTEQNRLSRDRGNGTEWSLGDAENLPFLDGSFDAVVSFDVFEHLSSVEAAISEVARVLRVGGLLVCHMPVADVDWSLDGFQRRFWGAKWKAGQASVGHFHEKMASRDELLQMFARANLEVVQSESFNVWVQPWHDHKVLPLLGRIRHGGRGVHERQASPSSTTQVAAGGGGFQALYSTLVLPVFRLIALVDRIGVALGVGGSHSFIVRKSAPSANS
jgi:ubiquinone/menaquinone biosynthesis C-methylase UbiE